MAELGESLVAVEAAGPRARLSFRAGERDRIEAFAEAESRCCPFFDFGVEPRDAVVDLTVEAPEDAEWAVRGLVAGFRPAG
jgi:hypothetical protein